MYHVFFWGLAIVSLIPAQSGDDSSAHSGVMVTYPLDRYHSLWEQTLFTLPTYSEDETPSSPKTIDYSLTGVARDKNGYVINIIEKISGENLILGSERNEGGLYLEEVRVSDKIEEVRAIINNQGQRIEIGFDLQQSTAQSPDFSSDPTATTQHSKRSFPHEGMLMPQGIPDHLIPPAVKQIIKRQEPIPSQK